MEKMDLAKTDKTYYTAKTTPGFVSIGPTAFLSVTGKGDPSGSLFTEKIQALYSTAYALKFASKAGGQDFVVSKLEGLWWFDEARFGTPSIAEAPEKVPRSEWEYRLLIRMPAFIRKDNVLEARETVAIKKGLPWLEAVEFFEMEEGECIQMLHLGPFSTEPETLSKMEAFIKANRLGKNGLHHEIYLSNFNTTPPDRLKTILREPVRRLK